MADIPEDDLEEYACLKCIRLIKKGAKCAKCGIQALKNIKGK